MKTKLLAALLCFASCAPPFVDSASGQCAGPMSYTIPIVAGFNLIANQFNCGGNTLAEIIPAPPDGTFVAVFNNAAKSYMVATYDVAFGGWDVPLRLSPGQGAFLNSPVAFNLTLSGMPNVPVLPVPLQPGACCLLSRQINALGTYDNIVGTPPTDGTVLYMWDAATQSYTAFTYDLGAWAPAVPVATVGEAVFICAPAAVIPLCGTTSKWSQRPGYLVFTNNPTMRGGDRPSDVDWQTLMQNTNLAEPNWVIADDFRSDGRPIVTLRWWGSYLSNAPVEFEDGFAVSFFSDVPAAENQFGQFSRPGVLLGTYVAPREAVRRRNTLQVGWDLLPIYQYEVNLKDTCLDHAVTNIAHPEAFLERSNTIYWVAITAEVGHRVAPVRNTNGVIVDWVQQPTNKHTTNHYWGWHTAPTNRLDVSVMGHLLMPGMNWLYPSNLWRPNQPFHMELDQAFELLTTNAPPPCETNPPVIVNFDFSCDTLKLVLDFNEALDPASATNPANYSAGGTITSIVLVDTNTVIVIFNPPPCPSFFGVCISNIKDLCGNVMSPGLCIDFFCPCPERPKVPKWSQLPGYLYFTNNPDMHGGDRPSDFDWGHLMQMGGTGTNVPVIDAMFDPNLWLPGVPVATNAVVFIAPSYAQTFVPHAPGLFEHCDLPICRVRANAPDLIVELRTTVSGVPGTTAASLLAAVTVPAPEIPDQEEWARDPQWIGIDWRPFNVPVVPGQAYAVVVRPSQQVQDNYTWLGRVGDPYPEGGAFVRANPAGSWAATNALDLGFCVIVATPQPATNHVIPPDWVIADDFRSDGRPILCVRWWGSYLQEPATNRVEDGFVISFFSDLPAGPVVPYSQPGRLLATYVVPYESVRATNTHWRGWDGHEIWSYEIELKETCLAHSNTPIATATGFLERSNTIYWLAIDAEIGHRVRPLTNHQGVVTNWLEQPTGRCACDYKHFWGWHTSPTNWNDASVMGNLFMQSKDWIYRNWMPNHPVHMELDQAFELLTATNLPCETIPPSIVSFSADCDSNRIVIKYSEPMDPATTEDPGNYVLSGGALVLNVMLDASGTVATLDISPLACGTTNTLVVKGVTDLCKNPLPTTTLAFICPPCPPAKIAKWSQPPGFLVFTNNPGMHGANRWSDFDWKLLMNSGLNIIEPNWVIAEDFRSDGRPILCVRWWGSYAPGFEPLPREGLFFEDGYVLSFFDDFRPPVFFSRPRRLLGSYVAPLEAVKIVPTPFLGWDGHRIWQYEVALADTCLDHAFQGIARPTAFLEKSNRVYWLAITAEVGHRVIPVRNTNGVTIDWLQQSTEKRATNHFWGWHTSPLQREAASVMGHVLMVGTNWVYPFDRWQPNEPLHMEIDQSFELLTGPVLCPAPTSLTIVRSATSATISWPGGGFVLQSTPALAKAIEETVWTDIATTSPVNQALGPGQSRFYRLICP